MAHNKGHPEGGSGGKRGHSGMEHWSPTADVKDDARHARRQEDRTEVADVEIHTWETEGGACH